MPGTQSQFWVSVAKTLIALVHARWDICRPANLITSRKVTIEDLVNQNTKSVSIDCCQRVTLDDVPTTLDNLGGCISGRIRDETTICLFACQLKPSPLDARLTNIYNRIFIVH